MIKDAGLFIKFLDTYAPDLRDRRAADLARGLAHTAGDISGLAMTLYSWAEDGLFPTTDEPWARLFNDHVDATLLKAAAMAMAGRAALLAPGSAVGTIEENGADIALVVKELRSLCNWIWTVATEVPTYADYESRTSDRIIPRREALPNFWMIPPDVLAWIEEQHDRDEEMWAAYEARRAAADRDAAALTDLEKERLLRLRKHQDRPPSP